MSSRLATPRQRNYFNAALGVKSSLSIAKQIKPGAYKFQVRAE